MSKATRLPVEIKYSKRVFSNNRKSLPVTTSITDLPMTKFNHLWKINHFDQLSTEADFICCPNFSPPNSKDKWFMKLRPKSIEEVTAREYIGIHLFLRSCEDKKTQLRAKYVISVLDNEGDRRYTGECSKHDGRIFKAGTEGHGYKLLAPRDVLLDSNHNMLGENKSLQILCEITIFGDVVHRLLPLVDMTVFTKEKINENSLSGDFKKLLVSSTGDVTIRCLDTREFLAHKWVLSTRSDVFEAMFEHEFTENTKNIITITDVESDIVKEMLHFIYTDEVESLDDNAFQLIIAADKYNLVKLKRMCAQHLIEYISPDNTGDILAIADVSNCPELKEKTLLFVTANAHTIFETDSWDSIVEKRPLLYKEAFEALAKKQKTENEKI